MPSHLPDTIGIVTAFFDIGRSEWTSAPHLHRPTDIYFERFAHLATLDNEMVIYTSEDFVPKIRALRKGKEDRTHIIPVPYAESFTEKREAIRRVQNDEDFRRRINPKQIQNPEYWSADYVLVNSLKSVFATHAVQYNLLRSPLVAWLDFGYCRSAETLDGNTQWQYPFAPDKIHLFVSSPDYAGVPISYIVENNLTFISGAAIITGRDLWQKLLGLTQIAMNELLKDNMIDDDQTLLLMASLYEPALFELHRIPKREWQPVLRLFNTNAEAA